MAYGNTRIERIILGEKVTSRSSEVNIEAYIQGVEINRIGIKRSGLPIIGKNPRYRIYDKLLSGSISDKNYYSDIDTTSLSELSREIIGNNSVDIEFPEGNIEQYISFVWDDERYGYGNYFQKDTIYNDEEKYNGTSFLENNLLKEAFPIDGSFVTSDNKVSFDGVIEPFNIRKKALKVLKGIIEEEDLDNVKGSKGLGLVSSYNISERLVTPMHFLDTNSRGISSSSYDPVIHSESILKKESSSKFVSSIYHFLDQDNYSLLISDNEIKSTQLGMDPTVDEGTLPITHIDSTVGFDSISRDRINSINYRGMTRG